VEAARQAGKEISMENGRQEEGRRIASAEGLSVMGSWI
jgi:hypothetical protein